MPENIPADLFFLRKADKCFGVSIVNQSMSLAIAKSQTLPSSHQPTWAEIFTCFPLITLLSLWKELQILETISSSNSPHRNINAAYSSSTPNEQKTPLFCIYLVNYRKNSVLNHQDGNMKKNISRYCPFQRLFIFCITFAIFLFIFLIH